MSRNGRTLAVTGAATAAAGLAALAANPTVRQEARRVGGVARPLPGRAPQPPGPAGLLLHGWTASADLNFCPVYARLAERYRVIALDLRGHGRGMRSTEPFSLEDCADDAAALLDEVGAGPVVVVGYSMGGPVALLLARRHPG